MNNNITRRQILARLEENDLAYSVLNLQDGLSVVVSEYGGRIFGPFLNETGPSLTWMNQAFQDTVAFERFLAAGDWNLGGERVWIAPEIQYNIRDRQDFWGSYTLPRQVDPGNYRLGACRDQCEMSMSLELECFNISSGTKALELARTIRAVDNPLRFTDQFRELMRNVKYCGFEHTLQLAEASTDDKLSESWVLLQLNPGGQLYIPISPLARVTEYYDPTDDKVCNRFDHFLRLEITGDRKYKIGVDAAGVNGRMAYINRLDKDTGYALVRNFFNNPSSVYAEEPHTRPGLKGNSVHVYNDSGRLGGFGEMECNGQTIGGTTGRSVSVDQMALWVFVGPLERIHEIVLYLTGIDTKTTQE